MNAIFFGAKRAFQASLRIMRPWFSRLGLTAARFDMLTAIWRHPCGVFQRELRKMLGVTAPTISRMLRSLEDLGLIRRERGMRDRRLRHIALTDAGLALIVRATYVFIDSGAAQLAVDCALTNDRAHDVSRCFVEMEHAEAMLAALRAGFRDIARLHYPWHPDD
ncbi:MAG: MarR family winged helix-turn-helix transcriptional regulator [Myxococcota bacterium]|nr:MarR family winged helix-turn-helix transcriptional regulator [Myxococcota bacterium]